MYNNNVKDDDNDNEMMKSHIGYESHYKSTFLIAFFKSALGSFYEPLCIACPIIQSLYIQWTILHTGFCNKF